MWLFTRYGLFSVTNARQGRGRPGAPLDPRRLQVRARSRKHLELLTERFRSLRGYEIIETPRADYRFRIIVRRRVWAKVAAGLAREIAYPNFKNECHNNDELDDAYIHALHRVWSAGDDIQREVHGRGAYGRGFPSILEDVRPEDYFPEGWLDGDFPEEDPDAPAEEFPEDDLPDGFHLIEVPA